MKRHATMTIDEVMNAQPVMPVITVTRVEQAAPLAETLIAAGLAVMEVTLRTEAALEAIREMAAVPGAVVGVGTVLSAQQADAAARAGARFVVTPGLSRATAAAVRYNGVPLLAGVMTPSEVMRGLDLGLTRFKFFPAEPAGGVAMLTSLQGPFPEVRFCPTGGISAARAPDYLKLANVACVGGGWVTPAKLLEAGDWKGIGALAHQAASLRG